MGWLALRATALGAGARRHARRLRLLGLHRGCVTASPALVVLGSTVLVIAMLPGLGPVARLTVVARLSGRTGIAGLVLVLVLVGGLVGGLVARRRVLRRR